MTASPNLQFLADTVLAEAEHLRTTDGRLSAMAMTPERAASLRTDIALAERTNALVARRLQDTVADKPAKPSASLCFLTPRCCGPDGDRAG